MKELLQIFLLNDSKGYSKLINSEKKNQITIENFLFTILKILNVFIDISQSSFYFKVFDEPHEKLFLVRNNTVMYCSIGNKKEFVLSLIDLNNEGNDAIINKLDFTKYLGVVFIYPHDKLMLLTRYQKKVYIQCNESHIFD